ncbi:hypothetical protein [Nocardia sp. NPDC052566]|uniref:hypothetical protein n=1 Tax=Nocardia sp. NPDC052566 TaxID=3364330 RepID=UPI0037C7AB17
MSRLVGPVGGFGDCDPVEGGGGVMSAGEEFAAEYLWLKSFQMPDVRIAYLLRISEAALVKRRERAGMGGGDPLALERLTVLVESGCEFDSFDFPFVLDPRDVRAALALAVRQGRIVRVRTRLDPIRSNRIGVYRAVPTEGQGSNGRNAN